MNRHFKIAGIIVFVLIGLAGCSDRSKKLIIPEHVSKEETVSSLLPESIQSEELSEEAAAKDPVSLIQPDGMDMEHRILVPEQFQRMPGAEGGLLHFLRTLPLKSDGSPVLLYDGREKGNQKAQAAVFAMDLDERDLQQCADAIIRIYAEYYWSRGDFEQIKFHLTNGFLLEYTKWREGGRLNVSGNAITMSQTAGYDDSYESFRKYLIQVFAYAGTLSMEQESEPISLDQLQAGDLWIRGGSPGHCVLVVDIAENDDGERCFLLAQGYMPAQDFHILKNNLHPEDPWYYISELTYPFSTPEYTFQEDHLKRWSDFLQ